QAEDGIRDFHVTGVQSCALPISEDIEISADLTTEEMVTLGGEIVAGKGTCLGCHTIGSTAAASSLRYPDLANIGARAATRVEGRSEERRVGKACRAGGGPEQ